MCRCEMTCIGSGRGQSNELRHSTTGYLNLECDFLRL
jgi:hypothetical protein